MFFVREKSFYKSVFAIAIPVVLQNVISTLLNMADTVMLGMVDSKTEETISAAGYANQVYFFYSLFIFGMCSGAAVLISQYWGKHDFVTINKVTGIAVIAAVSLGAVFSTVAFVFADSIIGIFTNSPEVEELGASYLRIALFSYLPVTVSLIMGGSLRATGQVKVVLITNASAILINIGLNYLLIFGKCGFPELGIRGAAVATLIARAVEFLAVIIYVAFFEKKVKYRISVMLRPGTTLVKDFVRYCTPVIFNETMWGLGITIHSVIIGNIGDDVYAAYAIANVLEKIAIIFSFGFSNASGIIIGREIGAGRSKNVMDYAKTLLFLSGFSVLVVFIVIYIFRWQLIGFYNITEETARIVATLLTFMIFTTAFKGYNTCAIVGTIRAGGDTVFAMLTDITPMYLFAIPLGAVMAFIVKVPVQYVYLALMSDEIIKVGITLKRISSGKWIRCIARDKVD